ncbi:MAG: hypothetical protein KatS3mg111_3936 [Pirellulaceae bacterium]|nr:MAG: hypothetical protein KatS3mg111_3936 [Pirellulaceae bacterium]
MTYSVNSCHRDDLRQPIGRLDTRRRGALTVCMLICLLVAFSLIAAAVHSVLQQRRHQWRQGRLHQAQWLIDAGRQQALHSLQADPAYAGEIWMMPAEVIQPAGATISINVTPRATSADDPQDRPKDVSTGGEPPRPAVQEVLIEIEVALPIHVDNPYETIHRSDAFPVSLPLVTGHALSPGVQS